MRRHSHQPAAFGCQRPVVFLAGVLIAAAAPNVCHAQFPYDGIVNTQSDPLYVHSGPSQDFYRTSKLERGSRVKLVAAERDGWLPIEPPADSFSWISGEFVRELSPTEGEVTGSNVNVRVGTLISESLDTTVQVKVQRGDHVRILGRRTTGQAPLVKVWYKIAPPPDEVRWVRAEYILPADGRRMPARSQLDATSTRRPDPAAVSKSTRQDRGAIRPAPAETAVNPASPMARALTAPQPDLLDRADAAYKAEQRKPPEDRDFSVARSLYQRAADATGDYDDISYIERKLQAIDAAEGRATKRDVSTTAPRNDRDSLEQKIRRSRERDAALLAMARKQQEVQPSDSTRYDGSGVLRKSGVTIDGRPAFVLISPQGTIRYYATAAPGVDLAKYRDQTVAVRGPLSYSTEVRAQHILVRDVTTIDARR